MDISPVPHPFPNHVCNHPTHPYPAEIPHKSLVTYPANHTQDHLAIMH